MRWPLLLVLSHISHASSQHPDHHYDSTHHELQEVSPLWYDNEREDTYVHYPDEMKDVLDASFKVLMRSPELYIFTTVPEPPNARVWPLVKGMTLRNHLDNKILWTIPNYLITDGLVYGCRQMVDGVEEHMPVENAICSDHCTHQGRYCAPFQPSAMPEELPAGFKGKELVKESLRRVCFDKYYHGSDIKYFEYLEQFERAQCLQQPDVTACSLQVIYGIPFADYSNLADCVDEENWENDVINVALQGQLADAKTYDAHLDNMPLVYIGNDRYTGLLGTKHIFSDYCSKFENRPMKPVSCHICDGPCGNRDDETRYCLWTLQCSRREPPFDPVGFLNEHQNEYLETDPPTTLAPITAPVVEEQAESATATLPPIPEAELTAEDTGDAESVKAYQAKEIHDDKQAIKLFAIIVLVCLALVGVMLFYRDRRTKQLMKEALTDSQLAYRDDEIYSDSIRGEENLELSPSRSGVVQRHKGSFPPSSTFLPEVS